MAQSYAEFGDLDIQQSGGQEEAEFGALEIQQAQVLFSALNALRQGQPPLAWESEAAAEIEDIKDRTSQAATATDDPIARRAVLLMTKRDLADLCLEGLLESTEQQQQDQLAALLQGIREYQSDTFDDWRDLLEEQERRTRDELDGSKAALESAQKANSELSVSLADEQASKALYSLKSKMAQIEVEQCEEEIKQLKDQPELDQLRNDNKNLSTDIEQHLLTIQQLTQQLQALSSLKRSRSTSDQPATASTDSAAVSHATDIQVDTFPGLETNSKPQDADSTAESGAVRKDKLTIRTVDPLGEEDSYLMSQKSLRWRRALSPRKSSLQEEWVLRGLTLHQLKDIITDIYASKHKADARYCDSMQAIITVIYASKNKADARSAEQRQPRETMEQHLLAYLTTKYGVRQLITQWLTSILAAVEHFAPLDAQTALFGKVLRNEVEEEFEEAQLRVVNSANSLLHNILQSRHPLMPDEAMAELAKQHLKGALPDDIWKEVVQGFCKIKDVAMVHQRVRAAAVVYDSAEGRALSPYRSRSASPRKEGSLPNSPKKEAASDGPIVSFHVVTQILLRWNLELHERALAPIVDAFRLIDDHKQGRLTRDQFSKFCNLINPAINQQEITSLLGTMAHCDSNMVTFSSCAHALVAELTKMMNHVSDAMVARMQS